MNNADFSNAESTDGIFNDLPANFTIYVKDTDAESFVKSIRNDANVIVQPLSS